MGQINYYNYEEFFILYTDNELSVEERKMVEDFIQMHPDLQEELQLLKQFKFIPDENITFPAKEELLQSNNKGIIHPENYEELFVQYVDEELTPEQKNRVEQLISGNPALQKELALFAKTRLQPDAIPHPDKASLYRNEAVIRPFLIRWWRVAAAAILVIGIGFTLFSITNKKHNITIKETLVKKDVPPVDINNPVRNTESQKQDEVKIAESISPERDLKENVEHSVVSTIMNNDKKEIQKNSAPEKNHTGQVIQKAISKEQLLLQPEIAVNDLKNKPSNNLPVPENNPYLKTADSKNTITQNQLKENVNPEIAGVTNKADSPSDIQQASYTDNAFTIEPSSGKKNKLRGFFRKLTRTFEKRTDINATDGDKLLVAGMAINLK